MAEGSDLLPELSAGSSSSDDSVMRILLLGRDGSGKSSSRNTILGENKFKVQKQKKYKADICEKIRNIGEKQVHVIDTPDLLDPNLTQEDFEVLKEKLLSVCTAGLSAVLLVVSLMKPVENEEEVLDIMNRLLRPEIQNYIMVLFTCQDELEDDETIDDYIQEHLDVQQLLKECGGRFFCFDNKHQVDSQVPELLHKIERMVEENGGKFLMQRMKRSGSMSCVINFSGAISPSDEVSPEHLTPEKNEQHLRLVLLGKTGAGKSATGNTILGRKIFNTSTASSSQTKQCRLETNVRIGKEISVIDTPGLYDNELNKDEVRTEIMKCITHSSPGPHAFLIVIKIGRFTEEGKKTVEQLKEVFGEQLEKYAIILFTYKDQLQKHNITIEEYLQNVDHDLQSLVESCGNRFFCLNNNSASFQQFKELISKIEMMVAENGGTHFTNDMFKGTGECIQEIQQKKLDEKVIKYKQEYKMVKLTEWQKIYWRLSKESRREAEEYFSDLCIVAVANFLGNELVTPEERESTVREAERKGISHEKAVSLAVRASAKLAKQTICGIQ